MDLRALDNVCGMTSWLCRSTAWCVVAADHLLEPGHFYGMRYRRNCGWSRQWTLF